MVAAFLLATTGIHFASSTLARANSCTAELDGTALVLGRYKQFIETMVPSTITYEDLQKMIANHNPLMPLIASNSSRVYLNELIELPAELPMILTPKFCKKLKVIRADSRVCFGKPYKVKTSASIPAD